MHSVQIGHQMEKAINDKNYLVNVKNIFNLLVN